MKNLLTIIAMIIFSSAQAQVMEFTIGDQHRIVDISDTGAIGNPVFETITFTAAFKDIQTRKARVDSLYQQEDGRLQKILADIKQYNQLAIWINHNYGSVPNARAKDSADVLLAATVSIGVQRVLLNQVHEALVKEEVLFDTVFITITQKLQNVTDQAFVSDQQLYQKIQKRIWYQSSKQLSQQYLAEGYLEPVNDLVNKMVEVFKKD